MEQVKACYREANACVKVDGELSDSFAIEVGEGQGCVMLRWFYIFMVGCKRELKAEVGRIGAKMKLNGEDRLPACLWMTLLLAESERKLQRVEDQFYSVYSRRKLRVNAGKSKVLERREIEMVNFGVPYRVSVPVDERLGGERMEVAKELKY